MIDRFTVSVNEGELRALWRVRKKYERITSWSGAIRECITRYERRVNEVEALEDEVADLEAEVERLQDAQTKLIEERTQTQALVKYVEDEQEDRSDWSLRDRLRWLATGKSPDE